MSTSDLSQLEKTLSTARTDKRVAVRGAGLLSQLFAAVASLRLTVVLFAFSLGLVFAGTLAQIDHDIWYVVQEYFRTGLAWIELKILFPRDWNVGGVLPYPGGWTLGALLAANLCAAHLLRFKVVASGRKLGIGTGLISLGIAITYAVVQSGLGDTVKSELTPQFCNGLWHALRAALGGGTLMLAYVLALSFRTRAISSPAWLWGMGAVVCVVLLGVTLYLFTHPEARLDPSGLRILWQLLKGGLAGVVLLGGCFLVFGNRAGIVLLHAGIGLIMFSELHTGITAEEARMQIAEGQTVNFAEDIRSAELAIIDKSNTQRDRVIVVPASLLAAAADSQQTLGHPDMPFDVRVQEYHPNAVTRMAQPGEAPCATQGWGKLRVVESRSPSTGAWRSCGKRSICRRRWWN